jgi:hypothetical protein
MSSDRDEQPRRSPLPVAVVIIGLGVFFLATGLNRPTIARMRTVDILHLTGAGANLGAGLVLLVSHFVRRREG